MYESYHTSGKKSYSFSVKQQLSFISVSYHVPMLSLSETFLHCFLPRVHTQTVNINVEITWTLYFKSYRHCTYIGMLFLEIIYSYIYFDFCLAYYQYWFLFIVITLPTNGSCLGHLKCRLSHAILVYIVNLLWWPREDIILLLRESAFDMWYFD
jgi:hypothetical protein